MHHWLACGPIATPLKHLATVIDAQGSAFVPGGRWAISNAPDSLDLKARVYRSLRRKIWRPRPRPSLHAPGPGGRRRWEYALAEEDHLIDFSLFNFVPTLMEGWLSACLAVSRPVTVSAELIAIGPARIWLNGSLLQHHTGFSYMEPVTVSLALPLRSGLNDLWLHGEMIGWREARLAVGLRLRERVPAVICLPLGKVPAAQWHRADAALSRLALTQFAFPSSPIRIWLDPTAPEPVEFQAEISGPPMGPSTSTPPAGARLTVEPGRAVELPISQTPAAGLAQGHDLRAAHTRGKSSAVAPPPELWSRLTGEDTLHLKISLGDGTPCIIRQALWAGRRNFRQQPYGDYESRRREALEQLAGMPEQILGAMAAVETGKADVIEPEAVALACRFMECRYDCADFYALSLLSLLDHYGNHPALRPKDRQRITEAFRGFKFWIDEPGVDAMCYHTENHQILFHVTAYLAGQRWPEMVLTNSGQTGQWQQGRARPRIEGWILRRLRSGFSEWDSNAYLALDAFAMLALVECAESPRLREMAATLLHKIFFMLACQSWRGIHGSSHGRTYVESLKTARLENTSALQRIAWGLGTWNGETRATGMLAMARRYRVPEIIQEIGADLPELLVTRARSAGRYRPRFDLRRGSWEANTLTHRTPEGMLSAAVDHRPGAVGIQEHLWQATLSPEAVVFTTHPGNSQEHGHARPNFWAGSARLPRVAMTGSTVLCLYNLTLGGGLPFTHAYFPAMAFDEYAMAGPWAFARVGNGYVALAGDGDLQLTTAGRHAGQEVRSLGKGQAWLCHLGRAAQHGDFAGFCRRVRQHPLWANDTRVGWRTPDGHRLAFGWEDPLRVDGRSQALGGFPHYDNAYTHTPMGAIRMTIHHGGKRLILDLAHGRHGT
jgi:hypothetical protein